MSSTTLVSTEQLQQNLARWRVFDCRHDLMKPDLGEQQYREAHIPGALFAHLDRDLSAPRENRGGRHPLPYPGAFLAWLGQQGVRPEDQVVCYDAGSGLPKAAPPPPTCRGSLIPAIPCACARTAWSASASSRSGAGT